MQAEAVVEQDLVLLAPEAQVAVDKVVVQQELLEQHLPEVVAVAAELVVQASLALTAAELVDPVL